MPNWVYNTLTVETDDQSVINKIRESITTTEKDENGNEYTRVTYNKLIPMPESIRNTVSGSITALGNYLLIGDGSSIPVPFERTEYEILKSKMDERAVQQIVFNPSLLSNNCYRQVTSLADIYLLNHPEAKSVTYGDLVHWLETVDTSPFPYKNHLDSAKESLKENRTQINNIKEYGCKDWYEWSITNWGVKWDVSDSEIIEQVAFSFSSPWGIPDPFLSKLSTTFPDVKFVVESEFEMESLAFRAVWLNGDIVESEETQLPWYDNAEQVYELDERTSVDEYFGEWTYYSFMETWFCNDELNAILEVKINAVDNKYHVMYTFRTRNSTDSIIYGTYTGGSYPTSMKGIDVIREDLVSSKPALESKFGHLLSWWFNKAKPE